MRIVVLLVKNVCFFFSYILSPVWTTHTVVRNKFTKSSIALYKSFSDARAQYSANCHCKFNGNVVSFGKDNNGNGTGAYFPFVPLARHKHTSALWICSSRTLCIFYNGNKSYCSKLPRVWCSAHCKLPATSLSRRRARWVGLAGKALSKNCKNFSRACRRDLSRPPQSLSANVVEVRARHERGGDAPSEGFPKTVIFLPDPRSALLPTSLSPSDFSPIFESREGLSENRALSSRKSGSMTNWNDRRRRERFPIISVRAVRCLSSTNAYAREKREFPLRAMISGDWWTHLKGFYFDDVKVVCIKPK